MNELLQRALQLGLYQAGDEPRDGLERLHNWLLTHRPDEHDADFDDHMAELCAVQRALESFAAPASA